MSTMGTKSSRQGEALAPLPTATEDRPRTRGECPTTRPCPWVGCRYHLYLEVHPRNGSILFSFPDLEPWELAETCALDAAERADRKNGFTLQEVADRMNITRERVRQLQDHALEKLAKRWRWPR